MTQKPHKLTRTKDRPFPTVFYFIDTETKMKQVGHKTKLHSLKLGVCQKHERIDDDDLIFRKEIVIKDRQKFNTWLVGDIRQKSHVYIIAHNVVYDATILDMFRELPKHGYKMTSVYSKGQVCIVRWSKGTSKITMLDNGNIFGGSLERWGRIFGIPKMTINFDTCSFDDLLVYCRRDVEIMVRSWREWMKFITLNDCGGFRETVGSTAFNTWRHRYLNTEVYVHKTDEVIKLERDGYHGGRVEAFFQGRIDNDRFYYLDINNMYGHVMRSFAYPVGLQGHSMRMGISRMIEKLSRYSVVARVIVNVDEPAYITKINGFACYPLGRFETVLTTHEIEYGLERGWIEDVKEFSWYRNDDIFKGFINDFYRLRLDYRERNNPGFEAICKLLINSLYGKFGQTGINQQVIGKAEYNEVWHMPVINAQTGKRSYQTALGGSVFETFNEGESYHAMPVIAAHVTANARLYLLSIIKKAGFENVFYCDTDSVIVNSMGYYNLAEMIKPDILGMLKVECESDYLVVNAPKDYEMGDRKKIKGVRINAVEISEGTYLQEQWVKLAGLIRSGFSEGYTSKEIVKHQKRIIHSGYLTMSGRIVPFELH